MAWRQQGYAAPGPSEPRSHPAMAAGGTACAGPAAEDGQLRSIADLPEAFHGVFQGFRLRLAVP